MKFRSIKDVENFVPKKGSFKHTLRKIEEDGRIVKGVNTTADVDVNSISKEAGKFGNKVDKDGRPPTLSKKVKGSSTNVLYNLGLTESIGKDTLALTKNAIQHLINSFDDGKISKEQAHKQLDQELDNLVDDGYSDASDLKFRKSAHNSLGNFLDSMEKRGVDNTDESVLQYSMLEAKVGELSKASEIYVDMDGVLADFFGEWAKVMKVDHYSKIDNVDINVALQKIRDTDNFWLKLPMLPQAKQLLELIKKVKGSYNICSSPLADDPNSEPHKREWIKKNLSFFPPKEVIITSNKPKYATQEDGTPNILIDDFGKNVNAWEAAGGEGFKYKDHKFERTAKELQQHMNEPATERELTKGEEKKKEKYVKGMKKSKGDFKDRYGKDADAVMYATATKMAKEGKHIPNPKNAFITKADTAYDFIKIGTNMANLKDMPTGISNYDEPDIMIAPYAGKKEMKYLQKELKRLGYKTQDADGYQDAHYDDKPTGGEAPPQVKNEGKLGRLKLSKLRPVQKKRKFSKLFNQLKRMGEDNMSPITVDKHGHIVNGHHRYDALRLMGEEYATVRMLDVHVSETLDENFADGKKKGKSKPGRVKKSGASCNGSVTSLRTKAKKYSGEKAKMYHWCANMKSGRKKSK